MFRTAISVPASHPSPTLIPQPLVRKPLPSHEILSTEDLALLLTYAHLGSLCMILRQGAPEQSLLAKSHFERTMNDMVIDADGNPESLTTEAIYVANLSKRLATILTTAE